MDRAMFDGYKLRKRRLALKITAQEMSERIHLSEASSYRRIEKSGLTSLNSFEKICAQIKLPMNELQIELHFGKFLNRLDVYSIKVFLLKYNLFSKSKCYLLFSILLNMNKGSCAKELAMKVLLQKYRIESGDLEINTISMYEDICLMKALGWIYFKHIDPKREKNIEVSITYRNPICKPVHHYNYLFCEIALSKSEIQNKVTWNVKSKSQCRLFLYQKDQNLVSQMMEDLFMLRHLGWVNFTVSPERFKSKIEIQLLRGFTN